MSYLSDLFNWRWTSRSREEHSVHEVETEVEEEMHSGGDVNLGGSVRVGEKRKKLQKKATRKKMGVALEG